MISTRTVNAYLRSIYGKLDVTTPTATASYATEYKLIRILPCPSCVCYTPDGARDTQMTTRNTTIKFTESEYTTLHAIARRRRKTVPTLVKEAVTKTYLRPQNARKKRRRLDFATLPAFGIWKDDPRTDDTILNDLGSIWSTLSSNEPSPAN